ncbi:MAG: DMT family transporter [Noviherbaspirillum sp.]
MDSRKPIDSLATGLMVVLCLVWGLQQVALKAAAPDVAPLFQIALRSGVAAALVGLLVLVRREKLRLRGGPWRAGLLVGCLFALEFLLVGEGLRHTTASHMVVFLYSAPIFAGLGLHWKLPAERLQPLQWAGIVLAFAGIAMAFFGRGAGTAGPAPENMLWGDFLGLLAGMAWGATTVLIRCTSLSRASATETLLYQLVAAFVLLTLAAIALGQTGFRHTSLAWSSLLFQSLVVSFASLLGWFWLLRHYLASRLGVFTFMTPLFGIGFGVWLLDEPLEAGFMAGAILVLSGIVLVSGPGWIKSLIQNLIRRAGQARDAG